MFYCKIYLTFYVKDEPELLRDNKIVSFQILFKNLNSTIVFILLLWLHFRFRLRLPFVTIRGTQYRKRCL